MDASVRINCIVCRDADGAPVPVEERRDVPLQELNTYEGVLRWASAQHGQRKWLLRNLTSGVLIASEAQLAQALPGGSRLEVLDEAATCIEMEETISVCPKPLAPKQEVQKLFVHGIKGGLTELLDNSLRAVMEPCNRQRMPLDCQWAPYIWVDFIDSANDDEAALVIQDNGVGMREEVARTFLKMTQSWSNPPKIARSKNNPLKLDEYLNPHLSRYGLGVNATHGFGRTCEVTTREVGSSLQCHVRLDNKERLDSYANGGTGWDASFKRVFVRDDESAHLNFEDVDPAAGFHLPYGTHTRITGLEKEVLADLRNPSVLKRIRAEVWQDYLLFLEGIPEIVRNNVPDHLRGYPAECDLTLSLFCKSLGVAPLRKSSLNSLPGDEQPVLKRMLDKLNRAAGGRDENRPFVLHLRYVPPNNQDALEDDVEEEPSNQDKALPHLCKVAKEASQLLQGPGAAPTGKKPGKRATIRKGTKSTGDPSAENDASGSKRKPAPPSRDQAFTVQEYDPVQDKSPPAIVDMLLVLFNFPLKAGLPSKLNAGNGAGAQGGSWADKEPFIYTFWSGRLLPQCELMGTLPNLVTMAHELGKFLNEKKAHKLDSQHLTGMLFLSPECDPTNHKTAAVECEAYQAFRDIGPEPQVALDQRQGEAIHSKGGMHTYDFERELLVKDAAGALATRLLLAHFKLTWRDLDDEGRLIDAVLEEHPAFVGLVEQSFKYQLANHPMVQDAVCANELVTLRHAPERPENATAPVSPGVTGVDSKGAKEFFVVEKFFSLGSDTLRQHQVQLRPWLPDWFDSAMEPSPKPNLHAVQDMVPLPFATNGARNDKAAELKKTWEDEFAPHHLAFIKREAREGGKASKGGRAAKKSDAGPSRETTMEPLEVEGPHKGGTGHAFRMTSLFDQVEVAVASKAGKPIARAGLSKNFDGLHNWGRKLVVTLDLQGSNKERTQVWREEFPAVERYCRFIVTGIREQVTSLGKYSLTMRVASDPESGAPQPKSDSASMQLLYEFQVVCDPPSKLTASFVGEDGQVVAREGCRLRLNDPKVNLQITLEDAHGQQVNIPDHCQPKLRVCVASTAAASSRAAESWDPLPQQKQPASWKPVRSVDRKTLTVQGFAVPGFSLGGGSRDALLEIEVATLKTDLHFTLVAAPGVRPVTDYMSNSRKDIAKGENLNVSLIQFKDNWGNLYVPDEVEQVELQLSMTNIADSRHQQVEAHKVKLGAQGIAQLPVWRAMGPMGSSAKLQVQCGLMAPNTSGEILCRKIFQVHLGFTHPGIKMMDEVEAAKGAQRANKGDDDQAGADALRSLKDKLSAFMSAKYPEVLRFYKVDLLNRVGKFQKPLAASRLVSLDGRNTWRLQSDVLAGMETKLDHSLLRPTGERYTLHQLKALVDGLNTRIQREQAVHEVVAVVRPGIKLLRNMGLQICRAEDDTLDPDWEANIKVRLLYKTRDNGHKELDLDDIQYKLCNKADSMPFALPLSDDLFEGHHTVVAEFADSHDQKIVYGRMYLRQVARPCNARLLPIGSLFLGQSMRQEVGPAKKVRSGLLARADAPEANTTAPGTLDPLGRLAGWKLGCSAVTMDTLEEMLVPEGDGPLMQRCTATRLFLMALDQFGVPIEVPANLRDNIKQQATVTVVPTGTSSTEGAGMGTPGPATAAPSARIVPDSWAWDLSIPVPVNHSPPWSVPCFSLEVQVERGTGPALLTIHLQRPAEEAAGSSSQAAATQAGEGLGAVSLAVTLPPNAMRKDGYQVQCEGNPRVRVQLKPPPDPIRRKRPRKSAPLSSVSAAVKPAEEGPASDEEGADATVSWEVFSPEDEHADLAIPLLDSDGNTVTARSVSDWSLERPDSLAGARLAVRDGMLRLALKAPRTNSSLRDRVAGFARGQGDAALAGHRLVLRPNSAHLSEVLPLAITVHVVGGSFLAGVMRTDESVDSDDWKPQFRLPDDLQGPAMLARLPSFQVYAGDGSPWLPQEHAGSSATATRASLTLEWRRLPDSVQAAADPAADMGQLVREGGPGLVQQVTILENGRLSTEVRMPAKVGRWGLCVNNAALPCGILVGVEVKAGRAFSVHLEETGSQEEQLLHHPPMHTLVLRSGERQQANAEPMAELMPKLGGWLLDRHGNRADAGPGMRLQLVVRQPLTPDVVLDTSEVTGSEPFEFTPTRTLAEIIKWGAQVREAAMQQAGVQVASEVLLPEYELVLVCSERRVELGHHQWEPLDAADAVQTLVRATLVELVGSIADSKELNKQMAGLRRNIDKLTNEKLSRAAQLIKLQEAAQAARDTMLATETELLKLLENHPKEQAVAHWTAEAASIKEQLEHGDLHTLDQRSPHILRPWVAPERTERSPRFPVVSLAAQLRNLPGLDSGQVLGPVVCLGAVERRQVAMSLVTLAGLQTLSMVAVRGAAASDRVREFLERNGVAPVDVLDLEDINAARVYCRDSDAALLRDPQQCLELDVHKRYHDLLKEGTNNQPLNFVGYAVNLVHLTPTQLSWRLTVGAKTYTLRQSLLWWLFRDAMVFETKSDISLFRTRSNAKNIHITSKLIALDGSTYNMRPGLQRTGQPHYYDLTWSRVPRDHQLASPLDHTVRQKKGDIDKLHDSPQFKG